MTMSDRIAVMDRGRIDQIGTPQQIYDDPVTQFVAAFIGNTNLVPVEVEAVCGAQARVRLGPHVFSAGVVGHVSAGTRGEISIRYERLRIGDAARNAAPGPGRRARGDLLGLSRAVCGDACTVRAGADG
jgi:ABC-type Fe3+/spermidine/putrescine transport system ATPase subunit